MRTFTVENGVVTPGFAAEVFRTSVLLRLDRSGVDGLCVNHANPPVVIDGRILRASFGPEYRRPMSKPESVDWATWQQWGRETPNVCREPRPSFDLEAEHTSEPAAGALVALKGEYIIPLTATFPRTNFTTSSDWQRHWRIVEMTQETELLFANGSRLVLDENGVPTLLTWQQHMLSQRKEDWTFEPGVCFRLDASRKLMSVRPTLRRGIAVTVGTPVGTAVSYGTDKHPGWMPLIGDANTESEVVAANVIHIGTRIIAAPEQANVDDKHLPLYGLTPLAETPDNPQVWLVRTNASIFRAESTLAGSPVILRGDDNESPYQFVTSGDIIIVLHASDVMSFEIDRESFVLHIQDGKLHVTPHQEWRVADMNRRPSEYLTPKWGSACATPTNAPHHWVGTRVKATLPDKSSITGELVGLHGATVLVKTEWSRGRAPRIVTCEPLWLTEAGMAFCQLTTDAQLDQFAEWNSAATFRSHVTEHVALSLTSDSNVNALVVSVVVVELSVSPRTGESVFAYGSPTFERHEGELLIRTSWSSSYEEALAVRTVFIETFGDESLQGRLRAAIAEAADFSNNDYVRSTLLR